MGGGQSLTIGLTHLEQFAWVGGMSASVAKREFVLGGVINDPKVANRQLKLLWFACGKSDGLMRPNEEMDKALTEHGVRHTFVPMEGGHEWNVWRRGLEELRIPTKSDTCSNSNRTLIPIDVGQLSERSDALGLVIKKCPV